VAVRQRQSTRHRIFLAGELGECLPIDECPVLSPLLAKTFGRLQELARSNRCLKKRWRLSFRGLDGFQAALNVAFERFPKATRRIGCDFSRGVAGTRESFAGG